MASHVAGEYSIRYLDQSTWPDFASLVEKHNGIWGGCWCMGFHLNTQRELTSTSPEENRSKKLKLVDKGRAHAAMVFSGTSCVGWCQFGVTEELPRIDFRKGYTTEIYGRPDWRITCFFVDRNYRRKGVAGRALRGAIDEIARLGGGIVEAYPYDAEKRPHSGSFNWGGTISMFEREGFRKSRKLARSQWIMTKLVNPHSGQTS